MASKNSYGSNKNEESYLQLNYLPNNFVPFMEFYSKKLKANFSTFGQCVLRGEEPDHRQIHNCPQLTEDEQKALSVFEPSVEASSRKRSV
jgi:hypothetical protein